MRIIIVGAGLFGSIAADVARRAGHEVVTIDAQKQYRASPAAGCVIKPSWLASIEKSRIQNGIAVLREIYGVEDFQLKANLGIMLDVQRVNPDKVLRKPDVKGVYVPAKHKGDVVLIAAGIWSADLVPNMPKMKWLTGASARFDGQLPEGRLDVYAPYRQAVAFNINKKQVWFGDGTAILFKNWEEATRLKSSAERAQKFGLRAKTSWTVGCRPYVEGHKAGFLHKVKKDLWVSTGGAKNGIVLAAAQAHEFVKGLK